MKKKILELVDAINEKAALADSLIEEGKYKEYNEAMAELKDMRDSLKNLKDAEDATHTPRNPKPVAPKTEDTVEAKFANAARHGFRNTMTEGVKTDGGYTVPEDIQTKIIKLREASFNLAQLVKSETVTTLTGERTFQKKKKKRGFSKIGEGGKYTATEQPEFFRQKYAVEKYGGYLPVSFELLDDSDAAINSVIIEWLADESRATRNRLVLDAINAGKTGESDAAPTYTTLAGIDDIIRAINVTLGSAYKRGAKIITNDNGLQALCELKDSNQRPLLNPNPADPAKMQLSAGATVIPVEVIPNEELDDVTVDTKKYPPFIIGDLKEAITLYDRKQFSIKSSDVATVTGLSAFDEDCLLFKGSERLDVKPRDTDAYVLGYLAIETKTPTKKKITPAA